MKFIHSTTAIALSLVASLVSVSVSANPVPEKRAITCKLNFIPACCTYISYISYPLVQPGKSGGCVARAVEPGGVCPSRGANTQGCCSQGLFNSQTTLSYQPDGTSYCYIP